jgi:hypothetical protein
LLTLALALLALALTMFTALAASGKVDHAEAFSTGNFCNYDVPGYGDVVAAGGRCVDSKRNRHRYIKGRVYYGDGTGQFCAGAKQNPDGSGGNTMAFACRPPAYNAWAITGTVLSPGTPLGYATIINQTGVTDFFLGYKQWYP